MSGVVLTTKEELQNHLAKHKELTAKFEAARTDLMAFNKMFDAWLQGALKMPDRQGQVHLAEILDAWDKMNG